MIGKGISPFFNRKGPNTITPAPIGDLFVEDFNPQAGTYTDTGNAVSIITTGNMSITGNGGIFTVGTNYTKLSEVVWSGNNWYFNTRCQPTTAASGQVGIWFGMKSINPVQPINLYWGIYYASPSNSWEIAIFNSSGNAVVANSPTNLTLADLEWAKLEASFVENVFTVTATNELTLSTASTSYTFSYVYPIVGSLKPNTGNLIVGAPMSPWNVSNITFGSNYLRNVWVAYTGDSISAGYNAGSEANRHQDQFATITGKTIETFAGAGDRSVELCDPIALSLYSQFFPTVIHVLIGTNDNILITFQNNLDAIISTFQAAGSRIYLGTQLARNGVNLTARNAYINGKNGIGGIVVIDYYTASEDPLNPGNIDPSFSDDGIHPNAAFCLIMANMQVTAGMAT